MSYRKQSNNDNKDSDDKLKLSDRELQMRAQSIRSVEKEGAVGRTAEKVTDVTMGTTIRLLGCLRLPLAIMSFAILAFALDRNESINIFGAGGLAFVLSVVFYFLIGLIIERVERRITMNRLSSY